MTDKTWASLSSGVVVELITLDGALVPGTDIPALWTDDVTAVAGIAPGWVKGSDGTFAAPVAPAPTGDMLRSYAATRLATTFAAGRTFNVAASDKPAKPVLCDGTNDTRADLAILALFGQGAPAGTKVWVDNDGVSTTLTGAELVALVTAAGTWIADGYATFGQVLAGIAASPPTVATLADVDAALSTIGA